MRASVPPVEWSETVRSGDARARTAFLESHLELVRYLALRIASRLPAGVEVEDLVHDGVVGLIDAVDRFDPTRDVRFTTYAETRVRGAILDGLRRRDWRPRSVRRARRELDDAVFRASRAGGGAATDEEIAATLGLDEAGYDDLLRAASVGPLLSLEGLPGGTELAEPKSASGPYDGAERRDTIEALLAGIRGLPEKERRVLELYYYEEMTMREIGQVLGVTESRVCQLHSQAAARLRTSLAAQFRATRQTAGAGPVGRTR